MAESKLTVNVGRTAAQLTINVQPASVAGPKGDKGDKGDPGDANITTQGIVDALGYTPADQLVVEQLAEDVEDIRQNGSSGGSGGTGADGEDGGYYRPNVDASGSLSWTPSKSDMPAVGSVNIKGPQGEPGSDGKDGSDASVTSANIASALGYTPADQLRVDQLADEVADLKQSGGGGSGDGSGGTGADGEDGGYYTPRVDGEGNLSWVASKSDMPAVSTVNIKGPQGEPGEKGDKGDKGDTGEAGPQGETGSAGADGKDGVSASHSWNGTVLTVTSASGTSAADLKGEKGDTGEPGPAGANGNDGYTPVKGTDYFTAADKSELVNAVLTALPAAEGVSY